MDSGCLDISPGNVYIYTMKKIYHVPHSSVHIPDEFLGEYQLSPDDLEREATLMADIRTDEMVEGLDAIIFPYSRLLCDVERFDSEEEEMNSVGMGVLYTKTSDGRDLRSNPSRDAIIPFYREHHETLSKKVSEALEEHGEVAIIDVHSYAKEALPYELHKDEARPEICIGINDTYNEKLVQEIIYTTEAFGFSWAINSPFKGALIPSGHEGDERVHSVMIEIRKDIYDTEEKLQKIKEYLRCVDEA